MEKLLYCVRTFNLSAAVAMAVAMAVAVVVTAK